MKPALISASPWTGEEARAGLIERATAAVGRIGTHTVRIIPEPLQRKVDGQSARSVRVIVEGEQVDLDGLEVLPSALLDAAPVLGAAFWLNSDESSSNTPSPNSLRSDNR